MYTDPRAMFVVPAFTRASSSKCSTPGCSETEPSGKPSALATRTRRSPTHGPPSPGQGQGRGLTPASASGPLAPAADRVHDRSRFLLSTEDPELSQGLTPSRNLHLRLQGRLCQGQGQDLQMGRRRVQGLDREQGMSVNVIL